MRDVILERLIERMIVSNLFTQLTGPEFKPPRRWLERYRDVRTKQTLMRIKKGQPLLQTPLM